MNAEAIGAVAVPLATALGIVVLALRSSRGLRVWLRAPIVRLADARPGPIVVRGALHALGAPILDAHGRRCVLVRSGVRTISVSIVTRGNAVSKSHHERWISPEENTSARAVLRDAAGAEIYVDMRGDVTLVDVAPAVESWTPEAFASVSPALSEEVQSNVEWVERVETSILEGARVTLLGTAVETQPANDEDEGARYRERPTLALSLGGEGDAPLFVSVRGRGERLLRALVPLLVVASIVVALVGVAALVWRDVELQQRLLR